MDGESANKRRRLEPKPHPANLNFISSLPDDMLLVIIGLLPTKSIMQTEGVLDKGVSGQPDYIHRPDYRSVKIQDSRLQPVSG